MGFRGILKKQCTYRGVEQLAARWAHNPKVGSSSLPPATTQKILLEISKILFCIIGKFYFLMIKNKKIKGTIKMPQKY